MSAMSRSSSAAHRVPAERLDSLRALIAAEKPAVEAAKRKGGIADVHVVVTGRNAKPELIAAADLVTEMTLVKHHFAAGVRAQEGIEF